MKGCVIMPKPYPKEFREDVLRVVNNREPGVSLPQIAKDFGISEATISKWVRNQNQVSNMVNNSNYSNEVNELRTRNRSLEQENEILRRAAAYLSQANLPKNDIPASY